MSSFRGGQSGLKTGYSSSDHSHAAGLRRPEGFLLPDALAIKGIDGTMAVIGSVVGDHDFRGQRAATSPVQTVVAADTGAYVLFTSFTGFLHKIRVCHILAADDHVIRLSFSYQPFGKRGAADGAHYAHRNLDSRLFCRMA